MKKYLKLALLIAWCYVIFNFSAQPSIDGVSATSKVIVILSKVLYTLMPNATIDLMDYSLIIAKIGHLGEFFILGLLTYLCFMDFTLSYYLYSYLFTLFYGFTDEFHQLFVEGRNSSLIDVGIDFFGASLAIFLIHNLRKCLKKS